MFEFLLGFFFGRYLGSLLIIGLIVIFLFLNPIAGSIILVSALLVGYYYMSKSSKESKSGWGKECPYCKEIIKSTAVICPYCGQSQDLLRVFENLSEEEETQEDSESNLKSN